MLTSFPLDLVSEPFLTSSDFIILPQVESRSSQLEDFFKNPTLGMPLGQNFKKNFFQITRAPTAVRFLRLEQLRVGATSPHRIRRRWFTKVLAESNISAGHEQ